MTTVRLISLMTLLLLSPAAHAEESEPSRKFGIGTTYSATVGQPLGLSVAAGLIIGSVPAKRVVCAFGYWADGVFVQVEPGIGGGKASIGIARSNFMGGVAIKSSIVRTWGKSWGTASGTSYAGGEIELAAFVKVQAGWLWKIGNGPGKGNMFTWGIGLGL